MKETVRKLSRSVAAGAVFVTTTASLISAQPVSTGRFELSGGGAYVAGLTLGSSDATETANQVPRGDRFTLFRSRITQASAPALEGRLTVHLTRLLAVEGGLTYARPAIRASISADGENAPSTTFTAEKLSQYVIEAGVRIGLTRTSRLQPFASAGAGYLRQLHDSALLAETGRAYYVGGGLRHTLLDRAQRFVKGAGMRADLRQVFHSGGFEVDPTKKRRRFIAGGVSLYVTF